MNSLQTKKIVYPVITTALAILLWQYAIGWFDVPSYLIPPPLAVLKALKVGLVDGLLWPHLLATFNAFALGYVSGCLVGLVLAAIISESHTLEIATYPLVVAFQSVPKMALAPILIVWFGFGIESKIIMVALMCFFPCFVNALAGFKSYNTNLVDLYRAFGASKTQIFFSVKVPSAATSIFAGLEISVVLALLGVVVTELIASRAGIGHIIATAGADFNVALMFACVIVLSVLGVVASQIIQSARYRIAFWDRKTQDTAVART